jgi:hypothetical protein
MKSLIYIYIYIYIYIKRYRGFKDNATKSRYNRYSTPGCGILVGPSLESVDFRTVSVAKTGKIRKKSKSEATRRAKQTRQVRKRAADLEENSPAEWI